MNDTTMLLLYGFDIGGTKIEFGVFNKETLDCIATERVPTPTTNYEELLQTIIDLITKYDNQFHNNNNHHLKSESQQEDEGGSLSSSSSLSSKLPSIGIGIPGIVDSNTGTLLTANIPCANNRNLQKDLEEKLKLKSSLSSSSSCPDGRKKCNRKIQIENDANCFALSEGYEFLRSSNNDEDSNNNSKNPSCILGIILGTGVGCGLIIDGKIYSGRHNIAGEFGHTKLPIDAWFYLQQQNFNNKSKIVDCEEPQTQQPPLFISGLGQKGCIDNYISGRGFELIYEHYYKEKKSAIEIISAYYHNNNNNNNNNAAAVNEHVERFIELLAIILANLFTTLDPHIVVLGGGLSNFDLLYEELPKRIPKHLLPMAECPKIVKAKYGDSGGGVRGAAFLNL